MNTNDYYIITAIRKSDGKLVGYGSSILSNKKQIIFTEDLYQCKHFTSEASARRELEIVRKPNGSTSKYSVGAPYRIQKVSIAMEQMPSSRRTRSTVKTSGEEATQ